MADTRLPSVVRFREEVVNVDLAHILQGYGLAANPEVIEGEARPDVRILVGGLKVILEGKTATKRRALATQAKKRLETGFADISIAVYYEAALAEAENEVALKEKLRAATYDGEIYHWGHEGVSRIPFERKTVSEMVEIINRVFHLYIRNDLLKKKVDEVNAAIGKLAGRGKQTSLHYRGSAVETRLRRALGIGDVDGQEATD